MKITIQRRSLLMSDNSCKHKGCYKDITCTLGYIDKRECKHFQSGYLEVSLTPISFRLEDNRPVYRREDVVREGLKLSISSGTDVRSLCKPIK